MQNSGKSKAQFQPHNLQARQKNQRMRPQISPEAQQHSPDFLAPQKQQRYRAVRPGSAPTTGDMAPIYNKSWSPESPGCAPEAFECLKGISQKIRRGTSNLRSGANRPEPSSGFGNMQFENELVILFISTHSTLTQLKSYNTVVKLPLSITSHASV